MFECKYKFELEDSIICAKYIYKSQKRKRDKFIACLIPILLAVMLALLIYDIVSNRPFVLDIIMLVAIVLLETVYLLIPVMLNRSQKKSYKKQKLDEMDYLLIKIDDSVCTETMFKDNEEKAKNIHSLKTLTSYLEDNNRLILVFNQLEFVCIRKANLTGDVNKLKVLLNKALAKTTKK